MNKNVLVKGWAGHDGEQDEITAITYEGKTTPILLSERSAMANLFRELGSALDGERDLAEFDLVYCCLEGTTAPILAKAQFAALISMVFALAGRDHGRAVHLFCDEFAQVCGDEGAARTVELLRSAGCGSGWFTQSWMGLGPNDDARHRLLDSCSGGVFVMRSYSAGQLAEKIGTRPTFAKSRKLIGGTRDGDEGNVSPTTPSSSRKRFSHRSPRATSCTSSAARPPSATSPHSIPTRCAHFPGSPNPPPRRPTRPPSRKAHNP